MQLELLGLWAGDWLAVGARQVPLHLVRHPRARRYLLRVTPDGAARVTVPRRGCEVEARRFAERHVDWVSRQLDRLAAQPRPGKEWRLGTSILLAGERVLIERDARDLTGRIRLGQQHLVVPETSGNLREAIERHLWTMARQELPLRVRELAHVHDFIEPRVSVRNQRSRWGSCSRRGTLSLNWRLVQFPPWVRDYLILHELAHLRHMNHGARFWREVEQLCPTYTQAERWLKQHSEVVR